MHHGLTGVHVDYAALTIGGGAYVAGPSVADVVIDLGTYGLVALLACIALTALVRQRRAQ